MATLDVKLKEAYDTEANWKKMNPVLLSGQLAFSSDKNGRYKIGNGISNWTQLQYNTLAWSDISAKPNSFNPSTHSHDDRYYTETEINTKLETKADVNVLTTHTSNSNVHVTSTDKTNWNAAKSHASSVHAPVNAQANQNAFSNVNVGNTTISANSPTDTLALVAGNNVQITPDSTNDKITISATDTKYAHPSTHPATMITEDSIHRFVTDSEKSVWNSKANRSHTHTLSQVSGVTPVAIGALKNNHILFQETEPVNQDEGGIWYKTTSL